MFLSGGSSEQFMSRLLQFVGKIHFHVVVGLGSVSLLVIGQGLFSVSYRLPLFPGLGPLQSQENPSSHSHAWTLSLLLLSHLSDVS